MSELSIANMDFEASKYIVILNYPPLIVCQQCQHAIWPKEVHRHYYGIEHRLSNQIVNQITAVVQGLNNLYQDASLLVHPIAVERPIQPLKLRRDGLLYRRVPAQCQYVCISENTIREHLRVAHNTSRYGRKGRPSKRQQQRQE